MPMDTTQAARDRVLPQIQGDNAQVTLDRRLLWAAIRAAGGTVTVHPNDLGAFVEGTSKLTADVDPTGAMVLKSV